jgi:hypothetical protein
VKEFSIGDIVRTGDDPHAIMQIHGIRNGSVFWGAHCTGDFITPKITECSPATADDIITFLAWNPNTVLSNEQTALVNAPTELNPVGKKFDSEKTQYHLMPLHALEQMNLVLMHGAKKYGEDNWQQVEGWQHRYYNAALRHIFAHRKGEKNDPESNISHLAHAICSLMFLIEKENES